MTWLESFPVKDKLRKLGGIHVETLIWGIDEVKVEDIDVRIRKIKIILSIIDMDNISHDNF